MRRAAGTAEGRAEEGGASDGGGPRAVVMTLAQLLEVQGQ